MSSNPERGKLIDAIDETIDRLEQSDFNLNRGLTNSIVYDALAREHGALLDRLAQQIKRQHCLAQISVRLREKENMATHAAAGTRQLSLPGIPTAILAKLPPRITIPGERKNDEARHKLLARTYVGEFLRYWNLLHEQKKADDIRYDAATFIKTVIVDQPDDMLVSEACAHATATEPA